MKKLWIFISASLLSLAFVTAGFCADVSVATLNWAPYISKDMPKQGYVAQIIRESFSREGMDVNFNFWPWARTKDMAKRGMVEAYGPEYYAKKLENKFYISDPFPGGPAGLFCLKKDDISYDSLQDLKKYNIGVVRGYVNEKEFDAASYLKKDPAKDDLTNIKKLFAERVDLIFCDKYVGKWLAKQNGYDPEKMKFIKPMVQHNLYLCFPKQVQGSQNNLNAFNSGLQKIKADGTLETTINSKNF